MKNFQLLLFYIFITGILFFGGCSNDQGSSHNNDQKLTEEEEIPDNNKNDNGFSEEEIRAAASDTFSEKELSSFVENGFSILDFKNGDLNRDEWTDVVLVLKSDKEVEAEENGDMINRPCLLLINAPGQGLLVAAKNDRVVMCSTCGGMMGDPYNNIVIKNGYFSIEHYGGSSWRWTRIITFKYDDKENDWYLHKDGGDSFHASDPENVETEVKTVKDFGKINFKDFDYEKNP